jgi:glycosyltransferase involved in cell wall biosynthesis
MEDTPVTRPKVLHIVGSSKFGGDSVLVMELCHAAADRGYESAVLATDPIFQRQIMDQGIMLVDLDVIRRSIRPFWDVRAMRRLTDYLAGADYSLVHTHTSKGGLVGRLAARRANVPAIIHTVHGFSFHDESGSVAESLYSGLERLGARWCDRIVTVSEFHRMQALEHHIGSEDQIIAIPNGVPNGRVETLRHRDIIRADLGVGDRFVVLSTGRLAEQKGLEYLIRAVQDTVDAVPALMVLLAGEGPLHSHLDQLIDELGVGDFVKLLGFRDDVAELLAAADVVVLPSLWEGLSISLLEAMAAGRPIVTTTIASNREVTRDGAVAMLVPPKDSSRLTSALRDLAASPETREELAAAGRREQLERYSLARMLDQYLDEYDRLTNSPAHLRGEDRARRPV